MPPYSSERRRARYQRARTGTLMPTGRPAKTVTPWEEDRAARLLVALMDDEGGVPAEYVAAALDMSRALVDEVTVGALAKVRAALTADGLDEHDFARWLSAKPESSHDSSTPVEWPSPSREVPLVVEPYSEHGLRVEEACRELDATVERARARRDVARVVEGMEL